MEAVRYFNEDTNFLPEHPELISEWVVNAIRAEGHEPEHLNFIFCSDEYLLEINRNYLNHDSYTDIITFDQSETEKIEGDIYISIDRIRDNANQYKAPFTHELLRVIIHGVLHLLGYGDKNDTEKEHMRKKEEAYISLQNIYRW